MKSVFFVSFLFMKSFCGTNTELEVCDPMAGRFHQGSHNVPADFLNEDGNWDNKTWMDHEQRKQKFEPTPECIDLQLGETLEQRLNKIESEIDMRR